MAKPILPNPSKTGRQPRGCLHPDGVLAAKIAASHVLPLKLPRYRFLTNNPVLRVLR